MINTVNDLRHRRMLALEEMIRDYASKNGYRLSYCCKETSIATTFHFYKSGNCLVHTYTIFWDNVVNVYDTFVEVCNKIEGKVDMNKYVDKKSLEEHNQLVGEYMKHDVEQTKLLINSIYGSGSYIPSRANGKPSMTFENWVKYTFENGRRLVRYNGLPTIERVIFNDPATIVMWKDGTKTVVKCQNGEAFDQEKGLAMAICKKVYGLKEFKKFLITEEEVAKYGNVAEEAAKFGITTSEAAKNVENFKQAVDATFSFKDFQ